MKNLTRYLTLSERSNLVFCNLSTSINTNPPTLLSNNLYQNPFLSSTIKLPIKNLLPGAKIQFAFGNSNNNLPSHYLSFQMGISIFLTIIMAILGNRFMWCKFLKPYVKVVVKSRFIIVYKNRCCYMHGIYEHKPFLNTTFPETGFNLRRNIYKSSSRRHFNHCL